MIEQIAHAIYHLGADGRGQSPACGSVEETLRGAVGADLGAEFDKPFADRWRDAALLAAYFRVLGKVHFVSLWWDCEKQ